MEMKAYLSIIRRRWWLIVLGAVLTGSLVYVISVNSTPIYRSTLRLLIDEPPGSSGTDYAQLLLEQRLALTYAEIIETRSVLEETISQLGLSYSTSQLQSMVSTAVLRDTKVIDVSVEDADPVRVAAIANTIGEVFIRQNHERESLRYAEPIANWDERANEIALEIETLEEQIESQGGGQSGERSAGASLLETQLAEARSRYADALDNINALLAEQARQSSNVVQLEPAEPGDAPVRPRTFRDTVVATVIGALVGLGTIFLLEYLDDTVKEVEQIQGDTGLPTLANVAIIKDIKEPGRLVAHIRPRDPISEGYRTLRTNLTFAAVDGSLKSVLVTSATPEDGKSVTIANLAIVFAQAGKQVVLVDTDLRRPVQHEFFGLQNIGGVTETILESKAPVYKYLQETMIPNLLVLPSGPPPPNPAELLGSQRMSEVYEALLEEADIVLFDTPPVLSVTDAAVLAPKVSGCLLVVKSGKTKREALVQMTNTLEASNAKLYGVVVNMVRRGRGSYYYYEYKERKAEGMRIRERVAARG
jgi:succinoglycan biosynthesis transport protein ExoP